MMTISKQELFDRTFQAIIRQGEPSAFISESGSVVCRYRNGDCKCAAGFWIKDDHYKEQYEGKGVMYHNVWSMVAKSYPELENHYSRALLESLQSVHDAAAKACWDPHKKEFNKEIFIRDYRYRMKRLADAWSLEMPINV